MTKFSGSSQPAPQTLVTDTCGGCNTDYDVDWVV